MSQKHLDIANALLRQHVDAILPIFAGVDMTPGDAIGWIESILDARLVGDSRMTELLGHTRLTGCHARALFGGVVDGANSIIVSLDPFTMHALMVACDEPTLCDGRITPFRN